jgi:hypothetical protein
VRGDLLFDQEQDQLKGHILPTDSKKEIHKLNSSLSQSVQPPFAAWLEIAKRKMTRGEDTGFGPICCSATMPEPFDVDEMRRERREKRQSCFIN